MIDTENLKKDILSTLDMIEQDCKTLISRIPKYKEAAIKIKSDKDYEAFLADFNLDEGLNVFEFRR